MATSLPVAEWIAVGSFSDHTQLFRGDQISVNLYDDKGLLPDLSFVFAICSDEQGEPHNWPREVAEHINTHIPFLRAGRRMDQGWIVAYRDNRIYALKYSGIDKVDLSFKCIAKPMRKKVVDDGDYDHIYPINHESYKDGDRVLHLETGKIYRCKPWPYIEFCRLGRKMHEQYEPGVGLNWSWAWQQISP